MNGLEMTLDKKSANNEVKKKVNKVVNIIKSFAAIVSTFVVGIFSFDNIQPTDNEKFFYVQAYEEYIYYEVSFEEYSDDLTVTLHNDFTNREEKLSDSSSWGVFKGLKPNMTYTLTLKQGSKVIAKRTVVTKNEWGKDIQPDYDETEKELNSGSNYTEIPATTDNDLPTNEYPQTDEDPATEKPITSDTGAPSNEQNYDSTTSGNNFATTEG